MTTRVILIIACVLGCLLGRSASADPGPDDRAKAASHFKQGQLYFKSADYDRAITEYEAAYALSQEPLLLFNIALCHDRAQRPEKALQGFQHYLDLAPDGDVAEEAREDVARLTPIVEELRAKRAAEEQAEKAKEAEQARQANEAKKAEAARTAEAARIERERRIASAAPLERRASREKLGAVVAAGVGVVAIGIGIKYGLDARADGQAISDFRGEMWADELLARQSAGHSANTKMIVFTAIGGACIAGGGVLYFLGMRTHREAERLQAIVVPAGDGATFALSGRF